MIIHEMEQKTEEWFQVRLGKCTASEFATATAKGRNGNESKTRKTFMLKLIAERMTGIAQDDAYTNHFMEWGNEWEQQARQCYELEKGVDVKQVGFVEMTENIGCSPDGLINENGLTQIKCPSSHVHIANILAGKTPPEYLKQIQGEMWVCEREWSDLVSYDPRNIARDFFCVRVNRDDKFIWELSDGINAFVDEMLKIECQLRGDTEKLLTMSIKKEKP